MVVDTVVVSTTVWISVTETSMASSGRGTTTGPPVVGMVTYNLHHVESLGSCSSSGQKRMLHGDLFSRSDLAAPSSGSADCSGPPILTAGFSLPRTNIELVRNLVNFCNYLRSVINES